MNSEKVAHFKKLLEEELHTVEEELQSLGSQDPSNPDEWDATTGDVDESATEEGELADREEQLEENKGEIAALEPQRDNILKALEKITHGEYGLCEMCEKEIEEERLEANPSAHTCIAHMGDE